MPVVRIAGVVSVAVRREQCLHIEAIKTIDESRILVLLQVAQQMVNGLPVRYARIGQEVAEHADSIHHVRTGAKIEVAQCTNSSTVWDLAHALATSIVLGQVVAAKRQAWQHRHVDALAIAHVEAIQDVDNVLVLRECKHAMLRFGSGAYMVRVLVHALVHARDLCTTCTHLARPLRAACMMVLLPCFLLLPCFFRMVTGLPLLLCASLCSRSHWIMIMLLFCCALLLRSHALLLCFCTMC